ncbi:MAG: hypothetical protein LAP21_28045, partial [Acidobacteriia bacterium]|nr:hypothetical protein [Terriglobia bacterium]
TPDYESDLAEGLHTAEVWAGDWADNEVHEAWTFLVAAPVATSNSTSPGIMATFWPRPNAAGWNNSAVVVYFQGIDGGSGLASVTDTTVVTTDGTSQAITGTATDLQQNTATVQVTLNIDQTPPAFDPIADVSVEATGPDGVDGTAVTLPTVTATDNLTGPPTIQAGSLSSTLPFGTTVVDVSATDGAGNTSYGSINVIVRDTTPPVINISQRTLNVSSGYADGAYVSWPAGQVTATDAVTSSPQIFLSAESGSYFNSADNPNDTFFVYVLAVDEAGNSASDYFEIRFNGPAWQPPALIPTVQTDGMGTPYDGTGAGALQVGCWGPFWVCSTVTSSVIIPDTGLSSGRFIDLQNPKP